MTFKPAIWYPIAAVLSAVNIAAIWFAAAPGEPAHATLHGALAVAFGLWAQRLRQRTGAGEMHARLEALEAEPERLGSVENELDQLRRELGETQERLDFAERMLAQGDPRRASPERRQPL